MLKINESDLPNIIKSHHNQVIFGLMQQLIYKWFIAIILKAYIPLMLKLFQIPYLYDLIDRIQTQKLLIWIQF